MEAFIRRIEAINSILNCVTYAEFAGARKKAREYDWILQFNPNHPDYKVRKKPLLGVPFCTQENIGIQGMYAPKLIKLLNTKEQN